MNSLSGILLYYLSSLYFLRLYLPLDLDLILKLTCIFLPYRTKRMSIEIGPSSFASRKKKSKKK